MSDLKSLQAVIFDVDGTLADTERHGHRVAFNRAFEQLGMPDRWDEELYKDLLKITGGVRRLRHYFENYTDVSGEKAADLAKRLHQIKTQAFVEVAASATIPPRPGLMDFISDLARSGIRLGVATTGTRAWVGPLVEGLCRSAGMDNIFETVVTGDDVTNRKPDPEAFLLALSNMNLQAGSAMAIEDSGNGVNAANAAGMVCLAVKGDYAEPQELMDAALVVDSYGSPEMPLSPIHDPFGVSPGPALKASTCVDLHAVASKSPGGQTA